MPCHDTRGLRRSVQALASGLGLGRPGATAAGGIPAASIGVRPRRGVRRRGRRPGVYDGAMRERPVLETERLRLRPPVPADCVRIRDLAGDRRIADTTSIPHPYPDGLAEEWVAGRRRAWQDGGSLALAVTRRDDTGLIGVASLNMTDGGGEAELGYWIGVEHWGQGYGSEAARAIVDYGFGRHGLSRINARCVSRNRASARIIEGLGFRCVRQMADGFARWGRPEAVDVYRLERPTWSPAGPDQ